MNIFISIMRYIKGYVVFKCEKGFTERFINLCALNKIHLWDISRKDKVLNACISTRDFKRLRIIVKRSGVKISVIKKVGLFYTAKSYKKRSGLIAGICFFVAFHFFMNQFIWCIDVKGNQTVSDEQIISSIKEHGLYFGTFTKNFDEVKVARLVAKEYSDRVKWLTVNLKGSMIEIELLEDKTLIKQEESTAPCNIIADFDGIILSIETLKGVQTALVGSGVAKGDLLISGISVSALDGSTSYCRAKGKITAKHTEIKESVYYPPVTTAMTETDSFSHVYFFGIEIPLGFHSQEENEEIFCETRHLEINGYRLPFMLKKFYVVSLEETDIPEKEKYLFAGESFVSEAYESHKNSRVISSKEDFYFSEGAYRLKGEYSLIDYIGVSVDINIEG